MSERNIITENVNLYSERIKDILLNQSVSDLTQLDSSVFDHVFEPLVSTLVTLHEDALMALDEEWDRGDDGFIAQIENIENVISI
jgi:hypothetical protein